MPVLWSLAAVLWACWRHLLLVLLAQGSWGVSAMLQVQQQA
jgi:hypothetical protein